MWYACQTLLTEECYPDRNIQWFCKHFEYSSCFITRQQTCCHPHHFCWQLRDLNEHYKVSAITAVHVHVVSLKVTGSLAGIKNTVEPSYLELSREMKTV